MVAAPVADPRAYAVAVRHAVRVLRQRDGVRDAEADWRRWLELVFPGHVARGFAPYHEEFWRWVWQLTPGERARPFVAIWPRGFGKSSSAELACPTVAALGIRRYGLYVCASQDQADDHVGNVAGMLESRDFGRAYPDVGDRRLSKYGASKGWRRNRIRTASGFTLDAIGLDTAARGVKLDEDRPDLLIFDDLDDNLDTAATTAKKIEMLTKKLIPAGSDATAVLAVQNLVIADGIFARLADGRADFLADRIVSGPHPAVENLAWETVGGRATIVGGDPTWEAMPIEACQALVDLEGISAFLAERQHETEPPAGGMFDHLEFRHCGWDELPDLVRIVGWVDPAVTNTDQSDSHAIQFDGLAADGRLFRLWSWEARTSPEDSLRRAITKGVELGAEAIGVETDQGGDAWESVYREATRAIVALGMDAGRVPEFRQAKAGAGLGPKAHRASLMLADYERARIVHVLGTHGVIERALRRFPRTKPFDLCVAMGTLVATERGPLPIESVAVGDRVHTRQGLRRVLWAGRTAPAAPLWRLETGDGRVLRATARHPIWTKHRGWLPLSSVRRGDIVLAWNDSAPTLSEQTASSTSVWRCAGALETLPSSLETSTCFTKAGNTTARLVATRTNARRCTEKSGKPLTVRFQRVLTSIMWMVILITMTWRTSPASAALSTECFTARRGRWNRRCWNIWTAFDRWQQSGTRAKTATRGTSGPVPLRGKGARRGWFPAPNAAPSLRHGTPGKPSCARGPAETPPPPETPSTTKRGTVESAVIPSNPGSITDRSIVAVLVQTVSGPGIDTPLAPVYNLTVEDAPEFFAAGILTHNCDAAFWSWHDLMDEGAAVTVGSWLGGKRS